MAENTKTFKDYFAIFKREKKWLLSTTSLILLVSFLVAFSLPATYKSRGTILIEQQEIPIDIVRSSVTSFADQRIQVITQRVITRSNLLEIINKYNLYAEQRARGTPTETVIDQMRDEINMEMISADVVDPRSGRPTQATIAFSVSYVSRSPSLAQKVANELTSLYLNENLKNRTRLASETTSFVSEEVARIRDTILELESKLSEFKQRNLNNLPEMASLNQQLYDRAERDLFEVERQISTLGERKIYLSSELTQVDPYSTLYSDTGERILSPTDRLKSLQSKYLTMSAVYGANLPDLIKLSREIDALKKEVGFVDNSSELEEQLNAMRGELAVASKRYGDQHPDVVQLQNKINVFEEELKRVKNSTVKTDGFTGTPDNPAYIQLQTQLEAVKSELKSQYEKKEKLQNKLTLYEDRLAKLPEVEREYRLLTRDYENALLKYRELKAKEVETKLSESLEIERKGERFTLIEPPQFPEKPIKPNRLAIMFLGFVFAFGGGFGSTLLRDGLSDTIKSTKELQQMTDIPVLSGISYIESRELKVKKNWRDTIKKIFMRTIILTVIVVLLLGLSHVFYKPLDVTWFVLLRKLGF